MAAIRITSRVRVVLEQVNVTSNPLLAEPLLSVYEQAFQDSLASFVMNNGLNDVVAFGCGVLRVTANIEVQPGTVAQEYIRTAAPRDHTSKQVTRDFIRGQAPLPRKVQVTPYSVSIPKIRLSMPATLRRNQCG